MSYEKINPNILKNDVQISRKTTSFDSVGGLTETWTVLYNSIKANLQKKSVEDRISINGRDVYRTHIAFLYPSSNIVLKEEDRLYDYNTNCYYTIVGVNRILGGNGEIHHLYLNLEAIRQSITNKQVSSISTKARIE